MAVGPVTNTNNPYVSNLNDTQAVQGRDITGDGLTNQTNSVPDTGQSYFGTILESLAQFMPEMSSDQLDVMILQITTKMKETEESSQKDKIKTDQESKRA